MKKLLVFSGLNSVLLNYHNYDQNETRTKEKVYHSYWKYFSMFFIIKIAI